MNKGVAALLGRTIGIVYLFETVALLAGLASLIAVVVWGQAGIEWVGKWIYVPLVIASAIATLAVAIGLILALFRRTRAYSGAILFLSAFVFGYGLWVWCLVIARIYAGNFWLILGTLVYGLGVIAVAFISSILRGEWSTVLEIGIMAVVIWGLRAGGTALLSWAEKQEQQEFYDLATER